MSTTQEYAPGRLVDIHGNGAAGIALFWHGRGPNERHAMAPLAEVVAGQGVRVLASDWDSTASDFGRSNLEASLSYARQTAVELGIDPERLVMVGWSLGATCALGLALQSSQPLRTVLVAPGYAERAVDPFSGLQLPEVFPPGRGLINVFWGNRDDIVNETMAGILATRLRDSGRTVTLIELDADHAGVVGTRYEPATELYVDDPAARAAKETVAAVIVAAAMGTFD